MEFGLRRGGGQEPLLTGPAAPATSFRRQATPERGIRSISPEQTANLFQNLNISWFTPLVKLASQRGLEAKSLEGSDLYPLCDKDLSEKQLWRLEQEWVVESSKANPSLVHALFRAFRYDVLMVGTIKFSFDILQFVKPFLLSQVIHAVEQGGDMGFSGYLSAICLFLTALAQAFFFAHYNKSGQRCAMRIRAGLILLIYRKSLRALPWETRPSGPGPAAAAEVPQRRSFWRRRSQPQSAPRARAGGSGQITNLVSSDTDKFLSLIPMINLLWSAPLQLIVCFILLGASVGWAALAGSAVMAGLVSLSTSLQGRARKSQTAAMRIKDTRLKLQTQLLKIIKTIKLYGWETAVEDSVKSHRRGELQQQLYYKMWNIGIFLSFQLSITMVSLATFTCFTWVMGRSLDPAAAFTSLVLFGVMQSPLGMLPMLARFLTEARVAAGRIQSFLVSLEVPPPPKPPSDPSLALRLEAQQLSWPDGSALLQGVHLGIRQGEFVAIVGRTGSGKSGLLNALLGELPIDSSTASAELAGSVGYCAQIPWIRNMSVRENIVGMPALTGQSADEERYQAALEACCLLPDLETLPHGDATMVGDRGVNLSGGQKQRIALCRAVYRDADVFVFDDVLSALDPHVASQVCSQLLRGPLLKSKTVVLVTHNHQALSLADRVVAIAEQRIVFDGPFERFEASGLEERCEDDPEEASAAAGSSLEDGAEVGRKPPNGHSGASNGSAAAKGNGQPSGSSSASSRTPSAPRRSAGEDRRERRERGAVSWKVWLTYLQASGGVLPVGFYLFTIVGTEGSKNFSDIWLSHWSDTGGTVDGLRMYVLAAVGALVFGAATIVMRTVVGQTMSRTLHERCQKTLLRAKMTFFDQTPMGQIMNRLAEDTNILDYNLPLSTFQNLISLWRTAAIVVLCVNVSWYILLLLVCLFVYYHSVARIYMPAVRDLRRIEMAARSPIFHHFGETLNGVSTIRVMGMQEENFEAKILKLEKQMEAYYLSNVAARWLGLRLQVNSAILVGAVALAGVALSETGSVETGVVGLALTYALRLTDVLNLLSLSTADRETHMVSLERINSYIENIEPEAPLEIPSTQPSQDWPPSGNILLEDIYARYRPELPYVLQGLSLDIKGGERVGIVGRTGCGKSSFLMSLMRLLEIDSGRMIIDGVDISTLGLHTLRTKVAIVPQEPAILTGDIRFNLDPLGEAASDDALLKALDAVSLRERVDAAGGLSGQVEEGGSNFSVGELQLMCLARALLRRLPKGGLLLLDEATSSLDAETDQKIQEIIRKEFHCTVIAIAHRVETLLDYDKIAVLDGGRVVEIGSPNELVARPTSHFAAMVSGGRSPKLLATSSATSIATSEPSASPLADDR
eukprot:TRINITY_DN59347_c0_g1_i1.p1 TRINITY_DN59347_c0_g1~~TRINITY_DN59347_c0_g1_i1.p1  ORF type:complete len:1365 (+),score=312.30 TRINITY_DN59347_c0_g1_i1:145-4239(+)